MIGPLFGPTQLANTFEVLGTTDKPIFGDQGIQLLKQILVATANRSGGGGGSGTVTNFSFTDANGIAGVVTNPTTTPNLTLSLGNITPSRVTVSTAGAVSVSDMALTGTIYSGGSATTTKPKFLIEPTGATSTNWSTSGTALGVNAASGFVGNLADFQLNGSRRFGLTYDGRLLATAGTGFPQYTADGSTGYGFRVATDRLDFWIGGSVYATIVNGGIGSAFDLAGGVGLTWGSNAALWGSTDGAGRIVQRVGLSPQAYSVANTYTSFTNKEEVELGWTGNVAHLWTVAGSGGGTARELHLGCDSSPALKIGVIGSIDFSALSASSDPALVATDSVVISVGGVAYKFLLATP